MKNKKNLIIGAIAFIVIVVTLLSAYSFFRDENKLTKKEKNYIKDIQGTVLNIGVVNDLNTFGMNGEGVFYDYLNGFAEKYDITLNMLTYNLGAVSNDFGFKISNTVSPTDFVFYKDHYVLISKEFVTINNINDLNNKNIGVLGTDLSYVSSYFKNINTTFKQFNDVTALMKEFSIGNEGLNYILIPMNKYLDTILRYNYNIVYHFSDIHEYYYLTSSGNSLLDSILSKYYNTWIDTKFDDSYYSSLYDVFINSLNVSQVDKESVTSKVYTFGVLDSAPYLSYTQRKFGGIVDIYLTGFKKMTNAEYRYKEYKNLKSYTKAFNKKEFDFTFNQYNLSNEYKTIDTAMNINYSIIANTNNEIVVNSLQSLSGKTVYILENSLLEKYFQNLNLVTIKTYNSEKSLFKLIKNKDNIIILDTNTFEYYHNTKIKNVVEKYRNNINDHYSFKFKNNDAFTKLFTKYSQTIDYNVAKITGVDNISMVIKGGTIVGKIIEYIVYIIISGALIIFIIIRSTHRIKLETKIKKQDTMKYIDILTSLKNRNYLNENISAWDKNTIYPQTTIIIDLDNVKYINDTYGHEEGDRQIKAAANILIKTQLDNSEIMRTDGNEFLIYLIGYSEKQIVSYVRKLYKEFNNLPYKYGATLGFSMINDDLKLVDDAINEATLDMRTNKDKKEE